MQYTGYIFRDMYNTSYDGRTIRSRCDRSRDDENIDPVHDGCP